MNAHYIPILGSDGIIVEHELSAGPLSGCGWQTPYEESATQKFPIGTRLQIDDRVYRYCHADSALLAIMAGHNSISDLGVNTAAVIHYAGAVEISILDLAVRDANYYENGYLWIMNMTTTAYIIYKIKSSLAAADADNHVHLTLWDPLAQNVPASTFVTVWPNIYAHITKTDTFFRTVVCIPQIPVQNGYYFWGQTWGPCFGIPQGGAPGAIMKNRDIYFGADGCLIAGEETVLETCVPQRAGTLLTATSNGSGDQFYMLQLTP